MMYIQSSETNRPTDRQAHFSGLSSMLPYLYESCCSSQLTDLKWAEVESVELEWEEGGGKEEACVMEPEGLWTIQCNGTALVTSIKNISAILCLWLPPLLLPLFIAPLVGRPALLSARLEQSCRRFLSLWLAGCLEFDRTWSQALTELHNNFRTWRFGDQQILRSLEKAIAGFRCSEIAICSVGGRQPGS